jgi:hypothetical protein
MKMSEKSLVEAMRLASSNRNDPRDKDDLGRFWIRFKTASFLNAESFPS